MARVTVEDCLAQIPNQFDLTLVAAKRARQLARGAEARLPWGNHKSTVLSLREIESRILPTMRDSEYLGPAYDSTAMAYRLKFIREGRVMFVDVDARTGRVIRRSR